MISTFIASALTVVSLPMVFPDAPVAMWRMDDEIGKFGLRLNRDESCQALVAPKGGRADVFHCSFILRGERILVKWKPREDHLQDYLPTEFIHFTNEDVVSVTGAVDRPLRRVRTVREFLAL